MAERASISDMPANADVRRPARSWLEQRWEARDPTPLEDAAAFWRLIAQAATIIMCALMLGVFLYLARAFLLPVLCALVVGMTLGPLVSWLARHGVPAWLSALVAVLALLGLMNAAILTLAQPISELTGRAYELGNAIRGKLHILDRPLAALADLQLALGMGGSREGIEVSPSRMFEGLLTIVTPAAVQFAIQLVLFFGTLFFFILGRSSFRTLAVNWFATRPARLRALKILNDIEDSLSGYLVVVTIINFALGVVTTICALLLGLPAPLFWGALAFGLNYIPYVGPAIMYMMLFVIGLLTYPTLAGALLPPSVFMLVTLIEGHFITPAILGRKVLQVHPLAIFLGIAFWAWLWGPVGAFLAMPILIVARVTSNHLYPRNNAELPG
jgi:predicted PurR-regulated permease PerM